MKSYLVACTILLHCFGSTLQAKPIEEASKEGASSASSPARETRETEGSKPSIESQPKTLLEFAVAGGWMMVPLCLSSLLLVTFLVERLIMLRRSQVVPLPILAASKAPINTSATGFDNLVSLLEVYPSSAARLLRTALNHIGSGAEKVEKAVNDAGQREIYLLRRNNWIFAVLGSVSPLIGLLGTVIGLVQAFREVAITGLGSGANLAPGIYEALVTTVAGLAIAIPAIAVYYALNARVDHYVFEMDGLVSSLVTTHDSQLKATQRLSS